MSERGEKRGEAGDVRAAHVPRGAILAAVAGNLLAIPQAFLLAEAIVSLLPAAVMGGEPAGFGFLPLLFAFALISLLRLSLETFALAWASRHASTVKLLLRRKWLDVFSLWSPLAVDRPARGEVAAMLADRTEVLDPWLTRYALARWRMRLIPLAIALSILPVSWAVTLLLLIAGPVIPLFMTLIGVHAEKMSQRQLGEAGLLTADLLDKLQGLATIRALNAGALIRKGLLLRGARLRRRTMEVLAIAFLSSAVLEFFSAIGIALCAVYIGFYLLGWISYGGDFTLAGGLAMLILAPEFFQPLRDFATAYHDRAAAFALDQRSEEMFHPPRPAILGASHTAPTPAPLSSASPASLVFSAVSLDAPDGTRRILDAISLTLEAGVHAALVGPSGAGKTALLAAAAGLIAGFSGQISIDGMALRKETIAALRPKIAWAGQEPLILHASVLANLDPGGRLRLSHEAAWDALEKVGLACVVRRMPRGLLTPLGETGAGLSRGELRRLSLARALFGHAGLLLADEPTADLDEETAALVRRALLQASHGRTLLLATHDQALAAMMARTILLKEGRITEESR